MCGEGEVFQASCSCSKDPWKELFGRTYSIVGSRTVQDTTIEPTVTVGGVGIADVEAGEAIKHVEYARQSDWK